MTLDIEKIKAAALAATKGEWDTDGFSSVGSTHNDQVNGGYFTALCEGPDKLANASFIAAANPSAVLELITQLKETQADLAEANSITIKIEKLLEGVEYRGDYAEGVRVLKDSLEAAEMANDSAANIINELDKKLEAAEKQVESLTEELNNRCIEQYQLQEQVAQQAARITLLEAAERDAERYRWLRDANDDPELYLMVAPDELGEAIDAAMK